MHVELEKKNCSHKVVKYKLSNPLVVVVIWEIQMKHPEVPVWAGCPPDTECPASGQSPPTKTKAILVKNSNKATNQFPSMAVVTKGKQAESHL